MPENGFLSYPGRGAPIDLDPDTQLFTTSGTWTKPANARWVRVIVAGGGGGGGGGRKSSNVAAGASERPWGGAGGGGGGISFIDIPADLLPSTVPVTIGAGGTAGAGATTANTNGSSGGNGGNTLFGDYLVGGGGGGGVGNQSGGARGHGILMGGRGGGSSFGNGASGIRSIGTSGGANGQQAGSDQTPIELVSSTFMAALPFSEPQKYGVLGTGGTGGAANFIGVRNFNASPGTFGNGGGGGGAGRTDYDAETGGVGGDGYCLVVSYGTPYRPIDIQEFSSNGTWNKPTDPRLTQAKVFVIGGGGGGGSGRRWNRLNGAYLTGSGLAISRVANCYASSPDSVATSITGDIDVKIKLNMYQWCHGAYVGAATGSGYTQVIAAKWTNTQRSWYLAVQSGGVLSFNWTTANSTILSTIATSHLPFDVNTTKWIRATMDVDNGAGGRTTKFYTSDDGTTWTQLGTTVTASGTTSIYDSTAAVTTPTTDAGQFNLMDGIIYRLIIENGYDGAGSVVFDANFETATAGATTFTESSSNAATVTINNASTNIAGGGGGSGGTVSYSEIPLATLPNQVTVSVGTGGTGGSSVTTDYTNGNAGTPGGNSSFGSYVYAMGGVPGYGGNTTAGVCGTGAISADINVVYGFIRGTLAGGGSGGNGRNASNGDASWALTAGNDANGYLTSGGGGGAGINTSGTTYTGGASTKPPGYGTIISDTTATANGVNLFASGPGIYGSTGGGGGSSNGTVNGGNGGRGSGGGGGAATANGTNSGAGGNGGDGYVLVVCT